MSIRFGSNTVYKTRTDYRINEGELDCGDIIYMFIKSIEKTINMEDEQSICSIGVVGDAGMCYESVSLNVREEAMPKYIPIAAALGQTAEFLTQMAANGEAVMKLACDLRIKLLTCELTATWKDMDAVPCPDDLLNVTTADGAYRLGDPIQLPTTTSSWIQTSYSKDQPSDDFGSQSATYTLKIPYPSGSDRAVYISDMPTYYPDWDDNECSA